MVDHFYHNCNSNTTKTVNAGPIFQLIVQNCQLFDKNFQLIGENIRGRFKMFFYLEVNPI